jgi:hypothetical protein
MDVPAQCCLVGSVVLETPPLDGIDTPRFDGNGVVVDDWLWVGHKFEPACSDAHTTRVGDLPACLCVPGQLRGYIMPKELETLDVHR